MRKLTLTIIGLYIGLLAAFSQTQVEECAW